ncbi:MAG: hypothetical protein L0Y72_11220 [Gemmataceae bacterium]|nr:hypothetical protein [Gemmataceae bacterium]MCI0739607.1 hypothetical protein [Gemmataceae bacterium]
MSETLQIPNLNPADARVAGLVFEFVQFLLDDDANLTPAGNLNGEARQKLRKRLEELMAAEEAGAGAEPGEPAASGAPLFDTVDPAKETAEAS